MITYTKEELGKIWGKKGLEAVAAALRAQHTKEREVELTSTPAAIHYRDYLYIEPENQYIAIDAQWWYEPKGHRIRAKIIGVTFYDNQAEMQKAMKESRKNQIHINLN